MFCVRKKTASSLEEAGNLMKTQMLKCHTDKNQRRWKGPAGQKGPEGHRLGEPFSNANGYEDRCLLKDEEDYDN